MYHKLNMSQQCGATVKKSNIILRCMKRNVICKTWEVIVLLYSTLVRPQLEHYMQFRLTHVREDVDKLERVQR